MSSEFKQQLKIQMHAREASSSDSWSRYLKLLLQFRGPCSRTVAHHQTAQLKMIRRRSGLSKTFQSASERHPRIYFQTAPLPKTVSGQRTRVTVCLTSTMHSAPMGASVFAITPRTPNRRLRQLQRTARTHRKCERLGHRCASCLRRRSDCSWRRRSSASSAAAVKMMSSMGHLHCVRSVPHRAPAARSSSSKN